MAALSKLKSSSVWILYSVYFLNWMQVHLRIWDIFTNSSATLFKYYYDVGLTFLVERFCIYSADYLHWTVESFGGQIGL